MKFIKIQKVKSENKNQYINKDLIQSFYESDSNQTTVINFTSGKRIIINENYEVFADRVSL